MPRSRRQADIRTVLGAESLRDELPATLAALTRPPAPEVTDATRRRYVVARVPKRVPSR